MKPVLSRRPFLKSFSSSFSFSLFYYIMTAIILLSINSENVYKSCESVSFCFCTVQKDVPANKTYTRLIRSSRVGNCLFLFARE